jgi:hypothetical protein
MYLLGLAEIFEEEFQKAKARLNITDDQLFRDFCELLSRRYDSYTDHEKEVLCRVFRGDELKE